MGPTRIFNNVNASKRLSLSKNSMRGLSAIGGLLCVLFGMLCTDGCSKRSGMAMKGEGKITGSPSDPPVTFLAQWSPSNRYVFHSQVTSSSEEPRLGVNKPIPQESTLGL